MSGLLVQDRWIDLRVQTCETANGARIADFYVLHYPEFVNALAVTPAGDLVRTRQWRQGARTVSLEFAGGGADPNERPLQAATRELLEETGYAGATGELLSVVWVDPVRQTNRVHTFLFTAARLVQPPLMDPAETLEVVELSPTAVHAALRSGELAHPLHVVSAMALLLHRPDLLKLAG
jgi:8-oxo-dGTP pyrophosphatase MutT (NUDIX family)